MIENNEIFRYFNSNCLEIPVSQIMEVDYRLNSEYYNGNDALNIKKGIVFKPLSDIASVFFPGIFKRILVDNPKYGIGFLTTSEIMVLEPVPDKYLSIELTKNMDIFRVEENTILVSRSGTIGNTIYVDEKLKKFAITEDALRVTPFENKHLGLIYFYFISEYGNNIITGKHSGAVVDHIYEDDLLRVPIPHFSEEIINIFYQNFLKIKNNRQVANKLIDKARKLVLQYNNLPILDESKLETLDPEREVLVKLTNLSEFTTDYRLDAHFYNPIAQKAVENIKTFSIDFLKLENLADCSYRGSRSTRNYVTQEYGIPFLSGKNVIQIRPDVKFVSKTETENIEDMLVKKGWILITRSGTLGRTVFIWGNYENHAASEHLIRVVPNENVIDKGYLFAFLSSEYGYYQLLRFKHGSVIDEITEDQIGKTIVPKPSNNQQSEIGELIREAFNLRAEAIKLEEEAQELLQKELTSNDEN